MEGNLSEMLQGVLSDPSAMEKLMGVAQNLMGGSTAKPQASPPPEEAVPTGSESRADSSRESKETGGFPLLASSLQAGNGERIALIRALRPYLSPERRRTADSLIKMLTMLKLADLNKLFKE